MVIAISPLSSVLSRRAGHSLRNALSARSVHVERRIEELGITLPTPSSPKANYNIICHASGNMLYVSGHLPIKVDGTLLTGRVGPETEGGRTIAEGYEAARHCGLNIISTLKSQLGDLDRVEQIVKVSYSMNLDWPVNAIFFLC